MFVLALVFNIIPMVLFFLPVIFIVLFVAKSKPKSWIISSVVFGLIVYGFFGYTGYRLSAFQKNAIDGQFFEKVFEDKKFTDEYFSQGPNQIFLPPHLLAEEKYPEIEKKYAHLNIKIVSKAAHSNGGLVWNAYDNGLSTFQIFVEDTLTKPNEVYINSFGWVHGISETSEVIYGSFFDVKPHLMW